MKNGNTEPLKPVDIAQKCREVYQDNELISREDFYKALKKTGYYLPTHYDTFIASYKIGYEEGLKADRQIDRDQLDNLFHNYFDCYADDGDYGLPAMTFNRFVETVEKIMKSPPLPSEQETKNQ